MNWQELTSPEIGALDRELPIVIPLGSCEQHGKHLPVCVDTLQLQGLVQRLNDAMGERVAILPPLWLGASHHHLDFPGTMSVRPQVFSMIVTEMALCLLGQGFRRLFFLNGHGGNLVPASQALGELIVTNDLADSSHIALASWWSLAAPALLPERLGMETPRLTHACEYETSFVLALREDLVKLAALDPGHVEKNRPWASDPRWQGRVEGFHRFHRWTSSGHMGSPTKATAQKGEAILQAVTRTLVEFLEDFGKWPDMEPLPRQNS